MKLRIVKAILVLKICQFITRKKKKNSELALEKIKEEYGDVQPKFNENGEILLTPEDELRMGQAINQYLAMI